MYSPPHQTMVKNMICELYAAPGFVEDDDSHNRFPLFSAVPDNTTNDNDLRTSAHESEERDGTIKVPSGSGFRIMTPFPWRLHEMLEEIEQKNMGWIVSWLPCGKAFQVHSAEHFADTIIPMYFRHTRYKSFQRQLYLYGFRALETSSVSKGVYFHPCFVRENRSLCKQIVRPKSVTPETKTKKRRRNNSRTEKSTGHHHHQDHEIENVVVQSMNGSSGCDGLVPSNTLQALVVDRVSPLTIDRNVTPEHSPDSSVVHPMQTESVTSTSPNLPTLTPQSSDENLNQLDTTKMFIKTMQLALRNPSANAVWDTKHLGASTSSFPLLDRLSNSSTPEMGPIVTMSTSSTGWIDYELPPTVSIADLFDVSDQTPSVTPLEQYKDDIISLFGGGPFMQ